MKKILVLIAILLAMLIVSGCELTLSRTQVEYDQKTNTVRRTTTILPDLEEQLNDLFN